MWRLRRGIDDRQMFKLQRPRRRHMLMLQATFLASTNLKRSSSSLSNPTCVARLLPPLHFYILTSWSREEAVWLCKTNSLHSVTSSLHALGAFAYHTVSWDIRLTERNHSCITGSSCIDLRKAWDRDVKSTGIVANSRNTKSQTRHIHSSPREYKREICYIKHVRTYVEREELYAQRVCTILRIPQTGQSRHIT